jgi:hypothetical protein
MGINQTRKVLAQLFQVHDAVIAIGLLQDCLRTPFRDLQRRNAPSRRTSNGDHKAGL